ncbi:MAG: hypothetical protein ABSF80_12010, partial [Chitinispirillaceae bacterium]
MKYLLDGCTKLLLSFLVVSAAGGLAPVHAGMQRLQLVDSQKISNVWSGDPVDFAFVARGDSQYIAYYDTASRMTVT